MEERVRNLLRRIPAMDELLAAPWIAEAAASLGRETVKGIFSDVVGELREALRSGRAESVDAASIDREVRRRTMLRGRRSLRGVVNATGVVVHTNLGRSCLHPEALDAVTEAASRYGTLEYDLHEGHRGKRNDHVEWLLCQATGADAALVVNNNAGAVLLSLAALAEGREVVVSRGELVEIGGSFRIPDILSFAGARMVEVGTTNRTHLSDYACAITPETSILLKVHPSNYRIEGFVASPSREELAELARSKELLFVEDLGSGVLVDLASVGLPGEPTVRECLLSGVDLVTFSGDKLLGGPQIGGIVGRKQLVDRLRNYPLARALRVDKMTLAGLEATLRLYLQGRWREIPTLSMLADDAAQLVPRAKRLRERLAHVFPGASWSLYDVEDTVGGGAFPAVALPGTAVGVRMEGTSAGELQMRLRRGEPPVVAGAREDVLLLHVRTLLPGDEEHVERAFSALADGVA